MSSDSSLTSKIIDRLQQQFAFPKKAAKGKYLRGGKCPDCGRKELYISAAKPFILVCNRKDNCGYEAHVKDLFDDLFTNWSERHPPSPENPTATADAYLLHERGFDLLGLRPAYTQEHYFDRKLGIGSATVRFELPGGFWWERILDQTKRFDRKANFKPGGSIDGQWWTCPGIDADQLAQADEIWIVEGIFDAIALEQGRFRRDREQMDGSEEGEDAAAPRLRRHAVSIMSSNFYPEKALEDLRAAVLRGPTPHRMPRLVWALDNGAAGSKAIRAYVRDAAEEGWPVAAAQARLEDDPGAKLDWNDLFLRGDRLTPKAIDDYLWHGEVLVAESAEDKAFLIWKRKRFASFHFVYRNRTYWAWFNKEAIRETIKEGFADDPELSVANIEVKELAAARKVASVVEIANCAFRALYKQRDEITYETAYWFRVDFPTDRPSTKGPFSPAAVSSGTEFAKSLIAIGTGAYWTGETAQLVRILQRQMASIKDVEPIPFTGYSRDHQAWLLGDIAVREGKLLAVNDNGFFDLGKKSAKLASRERLLKYIETDEACFRTDWLDDFWVAYRAKGLVTLAFWTGALFAEQIRAEQQSYPFLELIGQPGSGKTSLIMFHWKLLGRVLYEGIDPNRATAAGLSRTLAKIAGLPTVFVETKRDNGQVVRASAFDWDELLTAYNGGAVRVRGVANGGNDTFDPLFRSAILIEQNVAVDASPAMLERIIHLDFNKEGWSDATKQAARRIDALDVRAVSGFIIKATRAEAAFLDRFRTAYAAHEQQLRAMPAIVNQRLEHNHAQLLALIDALAVILPIAADRLEETKELARQMAVQRHRAIEAEHPDVAQFWERVEAIMADARNAEAVNWINHSRNGASGEYAINLAEYEQIASQRWRNQVNGTDLRRLLKQSKDPRFVAVKTVNSIKGRAVHCWVFQRTSVAAPQAA
ncbi:MAG: bifunctional DNA primase/helicase [Sphingobium sp.]|uniref:toprim domain-containing protein n=1 Tax=Sphingobium sp. TaxID=1912891 RepID=UPI003BAF1AC0